MDNPQPPVHRSTLPTTQEAKPAPRPWSVSLLLLGVLIITVINLTRFALSLRDWSFLKALGAISPMYLALSGLVWMLAGSIAMWGLWRAKSWAPGLLQAEALTYALYFWLDLLFLRDHLVSGAGMIAKIILPTNWLFYAIVTIVCLAYVEWTLRRPKVKAYFGLAEAKSISELPGNHHENEI